jgi:Protein of unknown function (DUF1214)
VIKLGEVVMILDLHRQGLSVSAIALQLGIDRKTVRKYIARGLSPPRSRTVPAHWSRSREPAFVQARPAWERSRRNSPPSFYYSGVGVQKRFGTQAIYPSTAVDANGTPLDGGKRYRLRLPKDVPVDDFWEVIAYSPITRSFIDTPANRIAVSSTNPVYKTNEDGSIDIEFSPTAPAGRENNWISTRPDEPFTVTLRFYGPQQRLLEKQWVPSDLEEDLQCRRRKRVFSVGPHWAWRNDGAWTFVTGGGFHLPVSASLFGAYRRMVRLKGPVGDGSQFASLSAPGL